MEHKDHVDLKVKLDHKGLKVLKVKKEKTEKLQKEL